MRHKFIYLLLSSVVLILNIHSQVDEWKVLTLTRSLTSINFLTQDKGWLFGGDCGFKTTNGGISWSTPIFFNNQIGVVDGSAESIYFIDSLTGWSCNNTNIILQTINGGNNWFPVYTGLSGIKLLTIHFLGSYGYSAGRNGSGNGLILKTTNQGINWINLSINYRYAINNIFITSSQKVFGSSWSSDTIIYSINGGTTWNYKKIGNGQPINKLFFLDSLIGWGAALESISKTTDGGENWTIFPNQITNPTNIYFLNSSTGWITTWKGDIWKTLNGGINWIRQRIGQSGTNNFESHTMDIYFKNDNVGYVSCGNGLLLKTTNSGTNWSNCLNVPLGNIKSIYFKNDNTGWILSNYFNLSEASYIYKTTNRGYDWLEIYSVEAKHLNSLFFINDIGYACGDSIIIKTIDGGVSWIIINLSPNNYKSLHFINSFGIVCGFNGSIIKTTNSGLTWNAQTSNTMEALNKIQLLDTQNGYITTDSGHVLKTTNGGVSWIITYPLDNKTYTSLNFTDLNNGFIAGYSNEPWGTRRVLLRTSNAGQNWQIVINLFSTGSHYYKDICFLNLLTGWITAYDNNRGYVVKSTNSGTNWFQTFAPFPSSPTGLTQGGINCLFSRSDNKLWAGGDHGLIISTAFPIGILPISNNIPEKFMLSQNYPNPFNPSTKIKFDIPKFSDVQLIIYDILGREVTILVNEQLKPGTYEVDWDGSNYSSGVYFYKLIVSDASASLSTSFIETKRMVLLK